MPGFDYDLDYATLDLRRQPELYRVARGEQGVLLVQPYKSRWRSFEISCPAGTERRDVTW